MRRCLAVASVLLAALALLAAGCGGGDDTGSTTAWADDLCTAVTTWTSSLNDAASSVSSNPTRQGLNDAANDARDVTDTFVDELHGLGTPDTATGAEAKDIVDQLATDLSNNVQDIQDGIKNASTVVGAVSTVRNTLTTMSNDLTSTVNQLRQLDPQGELKTAFEQADSCSSLTG